MYIFHIRYLVAYVIIKLSKGGSAGIIGRKWVF